MAIPVTTSWKLTFDEEFNGTSLNTNVWGNNWLGKDGAITKPINRDEITAYDPAQVSVSGGYLHLKAIASPVTVNGTSYDYRSGIVQTHDSFWQTYGYFEARMFVPGTGGVIDDWPAFWLDGENWPYDGELDVMEGLGGTAAYHFHSTYDDGDNGKTVPGDFTGWHIFGAQWEPGKVSFYYDNILVGYLTTGITDSPQYLILNLGIGVNSILSVPAEMLVDWVHVYSIDPNAVAVAPQSGYTGPGGVPLTQTIIGTTAADFLYGAVTEDRIVGKDGDDRLEGRYGNDALFGQLGNDALIGVAGADLMTGGAGADTFVFSTIGSSMPAGTGNYDTINDFSRLSGDKIALSDIDAKANVPGNQAFNFIGNASFSNHAGELRFALQDGSIFVYGDVNGDGVADFAVKLANITTIVASDFIL